MELNPIDSVFSRCRIVCVNPHSVSPPSLLQQHSDSKVQSSVFPSVLSLARANHKMKFNKRPVLDPLFKGSSVEEHQDLPNLVFFFTTLRRLSLQQYALDLT